MHDLALDTDVRALSHRLHDDVAPALAAYLASPFIQAAIAGLIDRSTYAAWLSAQQPIHDLLDQRIAERREGVALLASAVSDLRLPSAHLRADLADLGLQPAEPGDTARPAMAQISAAAEREPLKLFGHHYIREGLMNVHAYVAGKLRAAWGLPANARQGLRFLDPYGLGQRPLWARFCRDADKHNLTEHERQAVGTAAVFLLEHLVAVCSTVGAPRVDTIRPVPVTF